jgi:hypothetical protein
MPPEVTEPEAMAELPCQNEQGSKKTKHNKWLGSEPSRFGLDVEEAGVEAILEALTDGEKEELKDDTMLIRFLRANKVCIYREE